MNHVVKNKIKTILFASDNGHKLYSFFSKYVQKRRKSLSDAEYVKVAFRENTGVDLNLEEPKTFNDKLLWLSLYDHDPLKTKCADKYIVRDYVTQAGFDYILNTLHGVYDSVCEIDLSKLPERFFIKTNHDSGTYALVDKSNPTSLDSFERIEKALHRNYYEESREWQYKDIEPKIICEAVIDSNDTNGLIDYRFYCFNGCIGFIAVDVGTTDSRGNHAYMAKRNIYDENFNLIDAKLKREHFDSKLVKKPENFSEMKKIACVLARPFKHVRVDLYNVKGKIIFGEMTFCNAGGMQLLEPHRFNMFIGDMISLE